MPAPRATTVAPLRDQLEEIMTTEDMTNAVWNRILHDIFLPPRYLISPEYRFETRTQEGRRADLVVVDLDSVEDNQQVVVAYEGKERGGGGVALAAALKQATDCLKGRGVSGIAIAALGPEFKITNQGMQDAGSFKGDSNGRKWIGPNLDKIVDYLARTAGGF